MTTQSLALTFALAGAITFATRYAGLLLGDRAVPPFVARFLHFVPIAAFAALVTPGLTESGDEALARLLAAGIASVVVVRFGRLWLCLVVGMLVFWALRVAW
jgi:branched-subunit amino acid transport protein